MSARLFRSSPGIFHPPVLELSGNTGLGTSSTPHAVGQGQHNVSLIGPTAYRDLANVWRLVYPSIMGGTNSGPWRTFFAHTCR